MAGYFVSGDPDLRMEASFLAEELARRWPSVRFLERNDEANTARWALRMPSERELYPLYFFDEGFTNNLPVTAQSSTEELAQPFVAWR